MHSLSKRSNLAGYRCAFVAGDPRLVGELLAVRKNLGLMMPRPQQAAMVAALDDDAHVAQHATPAARAPPRRGGRIDHSEASLYLWATRGEDCWERSWLAERHPRRPGAFYGSGRHVRVAFTATDERATAVASAELGRSRGILAAPQAEAVVCRVAVHGRHQPAHSGRARAPSITALANSRPAIARAPAGPAVPSIGPCWSATVTPFGRVTLPGAGPSVRRWWSVEDVHVDVVAVLEDRRGRRRAPAVSVVAPAVARTAARGPDPVVEDDGPMSSRSAFATR